MAENPTGMGVDTHLGVGPGALPVSASALIPSADYKSVDPTAVEIPTLGATGVLLMVNMTAASGSGNTVTINIDGWDPVSASWLLLGTIVLTSAVAVFPVLIDPRVATATAKSLQMLLPGRLRIRPIGSGTRTTLTYSVGAALSL